MAGGMGIGSLAHPGFQEGRAHVHAMRNRRCLEERKRGSQRWLIDILTLFDE